MALSLGKFGIKEVADVRFYAANALKYDDGALVWNSEVTDHTKKLEFTTLKVSNLEFTAEQADARGGKGNTKLITWDHSREATLTLEDALLDINCLRALIGDSSDTNGVLITTDSFANNYCIVGVTYARDQESGDDHLFTFFVPNAKVSSELNLTMEADGDPTVFSMTLNVLRAGDDDNTMVALIPGTSKYTGDGGTAIFDTVVPADQ
jgi:hypothetical protein